MKRNGFIASASRRFIVTGLALILIVFTLIPTVTAFGASTPDDGVSVSDIGIIEDAPELPSEGNDKEVVSDGDDSAFDFVSPEKMLLSVGESSVTPRAAGSGSFIVRHTNPDGENPGNLCNDLSIGIAWDAEGNRITHTGFSYTSGSFHKGKLTKVVTSYIPEYSYGLVARPVSTAYARDVYVETSPVGAENWSPLVDSNGSPVKLTVRAYDTNYNVYVLDTPVEGDVDVRMTVVYAPKLDFYLRHMNQDGNAPANEGFYPCSTGVAMMLSDGTVSYPPLDKNPTLTNRLKPSELGGNVLSTYIPGTRVGAVAAPADECSIADYYIEKREKGTDDWELWKDSDGSSMLEYYRTTSEGWEIFLTKEGVPENIETQVTIVYKPYNDFYLRHMNKTGGAPGELGRPDYSTTMATLKKDGTISYANLYQGYFGERLAPSEIGGGVMGNYPDNARVGTVAAPNALCCVYDCYIETRARGTTEWTRWNDTDGSPMIEFYGETSEGWEIYLTKEPVPADTEARVTVVYEPGVRLGVYHYKDGTKTAPEDEAYRTLVRSVPSGGMGGISPYNKGIIEGRSTTFTYFQSPYTVGYDSTITITTNPNVGKCVKSIKLECAPKDTADYASDNGWTEWDADVLLDGEEYVEESGDVYYRQKFTVSKPTPEDKDIRITVYYGDGTDVQLMHSDEDGNAPDGMAYRTTLHDLSKLTSNKARRISLTETKLSGSVSIDPESELYIQVTPRKGYCVDRIVAYSRPHEDESDDNWTEWAIGGKPVVDMSDEEPLYYADESAGFYTSYRYDINAAMPTDKDIRFHVIYAEGMDVTLRHTSETATVAEAVDYTGIDVVNENGQKIIKSTNKRSGKLANNANELTRAITPGREISLVASAKSGYYIESITVETRPQDSADDSAWTVAPNAVTMPSEDYPTGKNTFKLAETVPTGKDMRITVNYEPIPDEYTIYAITTVGSAKINGTVISESDFTEIGKVVEGEEFVFTVNPNDDYTISNVYSGTTAASQTNTLTSADGKYTVAPDGNIYIKIELAAPVHRGALTVSNTVIGDNAPADAEFIYTVTFDNADVYSYTGSASGTIKSGDKITLKDNEEITISGIPVSTAFTVTQDEAENFVTSPASLKIEGIISSTPSVAAFSNTYNSSSVEPPAATGNLEISNKVTGNKADTTLKFPFKVEFSADGSYEYKIVNSKTRAITTVKSGDTIELAHGETAVIYGLPAGIAYKVTETDTKGYKMTSTGESGTIAEDGSKASFINEKNKPSENDSSVPKTGDDSTAEVAAIYVMQFAMLAMLMCIYSMKKFRKNDETELSDN